MKHGVYYRSVLECWLKTNLALKLLEVEFVLLELRNQLQLLLRKLSCSCHYHHFHQLLD